VSQWKLTQIMSTGASDPMLGEATSPLPSRRSPFPPGRAWQLMGVRSDPGPAPFFRAAAPRKTNGPPVAQTVVRGWDPTAINVDSD
jgi:hypothetical protein